MNVLQPSLFDDLTGAAAQREARSGRCLHDAHHNCAHSRGGPQENGVQLIDRLWRCSCACHPFQVYAPTDKWLRAGQDAA